MHTRRAMRRLKPDPTPREEEKNQYVLTLHSELSFVMGNGCTVFSVRSEGKTFELNRQNW